MFPRRMSLLEVRVSSRRISSRIFYVTLEDVAVFGECCPSGHDCSLNLLVIVFSGALSLSQVDLDLDLTFSI